MDKKGFLGLLIRTGIIMIILSAFIFYILSKKNSPDIVQSTAQTTLNTAAEKVGELAKDSKQENSSEEKRRKDKKNNSLEEIIYIPKNTAILLNSFSQKK